LQQAFYRGLAFAGYFDHVRALILWDIMHLVTFLCSNYIKND